ncbi:MAG: acyl--CoA ligase [Oscillospiraceae bacterium]|jgi:acyl-CoA synthetase (AMP-forming)/AMP-acid ligase II|nr:acyl--CoA ligase [Oscillospiraceae bacterium]
MELITELLRRNAVHRTDEIALVEVNPEVRERAAAELPDWKEMSLAERDAHPGYRKTYTWRQFDDRANRCAHLLAAQGIQPGEKVAILMMNCIEWLPIYFGILRGGYIAVPMNFRYAAEEITYCLQLADCSAVFFGPEFVKRMDTLQGTVPDVRLQIFVGDEAERPKYALNYKRAAAHCLKNLPEVPLSLDDLAAIYFSSGTTGFPKAILHKHRALAFAAVVEQAHHGQGEEDVFLCIPPLYHTGAKMHWFGSLLSGSRGILLRGTKPEWILSTAAKEGATIVWLLVPWAQDILDAIDNGEVDLAKYDLSNWRLMHIGAQPVPPSLIKRWKRFFSNHAYDTNYGLSESIGPGCVHLGVENISKVGAIGVPGYGWECKIIDENGLPVKAGKVGELAVKGDGVMVEYYNDPAATEAVLHEGWLYTGDMACQDEDGFIWLVDRKKDVIITGGENLYPVQIEDYLRGNAAIRDVAVIGLADERLGEIAAAIVEVREGFTLTEAEAIAFCADLPRYKRPRKWIFAPIPRNATGKIEKPKLRSLYAGGSIVEKQISG